MTAETTDKQTRPLLRSKTDRILAGVCGGIAETYGADPTAVRLLAAIIGIFTGILPMVLLYLVAAVIIPESTEPGVAAATAARPRFQAGQGALLVGAVLIVTGLAALANEVLRIEWDLMWPIMLVGLGGLLVALTLRRERV